MEDAAGCADCCWYNDKEAGRDETDDQEEALAYPPKVPVATLAVAEETPLGTAGRPRTSFVAAEAAAAAAIAAAAAA